MKTIKKVKVQNMESSRGNTSPNQFEIYTDDGKYFQSYSSVIAFRERKTGIMYLDENKWNYSTTTSKYRNIFLLETTKDTEKKIKSGEYILTDLN